MVNAFIYKYQCVYKNTLIELDFFKTNVYYQFHHSPIIKNRKRVFILSHLATLPTFKEGVGFEPTKPYGNGFQNKYCCLFPYTI